MIAINTCLPKQKTHKVWCTECHVRICYVVVSEEDECSHKYRVVLDGNSDCLIAIKCQKCGKIIELGITQ